MYLFIWNPFIYDSTVKMYNLTCWYHQPIFIRKSKLSFNRTKCQHIYIKMCLFLLYEVLYLLLFLFHHDNNSWFHCVDKYRELNRCTRHVLCFFIVILWFHWLSILHLDLTTGQSIRRKKKLHDQHCEKHMERKKMEEFFFQDYFIWEIESILCTQSFDIKIYFLWAKKY